MLRVLISGCGVAGPCLAWHLARLGVQCTVVEKAASIRSDGQNIDVNGTALLAVRQMGLLDELKRLNTSEKGTVVVNSKGNPIASFPIEEGSSASATSVFEILRGDLADMMYQASKSHPNVQYKFDTTVSKVLSNDTNGVKVQLSTKAEEYYDLLVLSDGQWSRLRRDNFPPESIRVADRNMYAIYWTLPREEQDNHYWSLNISTRSRILSIRPDPYNTMRACLGIMPLTDEQKKEWQSVLRADRRAQEDLVRKEFADAGWIAPRLIDSMAPSKDFYFQATQQIQMSQWHTGRIICIGDAAYAPTPLTGAGASLAILGAYCLAGEIGQLSTGQSLTSALEAYEKKFRPFVEETQHIPFFVPGIALPSWTLHRFLLQSSLWALSKILTIPWLKSRIDRDPFTEDASFPLPSYPVLQSKLTQT